ncbi:MAG: AbrB/MazE/SpoVT family DNA-binding domain-containing protein [Candidatus Omnitrophica bacterium]|nr:AbrB/MazE/SpoVT family DNA-binding domain-containing protein [Candidatus Omnitrophota bacterium]
MRNKNIRKLTVTGNGRSYYVTLPREIIRELKWKKGEKKVVLMEYGRIIIEDWKEKIR